MRDARFSSVHGLDSSSKEASAYASARDMARLLAYIASAKQSYFAATARESIIFSTTDGKGMIVPNTNLVQGAVPGLILGKTGLTDLAGGNLGVVFTIGLTKPFAAIVLGSSEQKRFSDMRILVDAAEEAY